MQVRIRKRAIEDKAVLVEWKYLEPLWLRSAFAPVDRNKLINAYSEQWFDRKCSPWRFTLGEIEFREGGQGKREILFCNGRNRTNLLIKHQDLIPVCVLGEMLNDEDIQRAVVKQLNEGDVVEIVDLPIYSMAEIRERLGAKHLGDMGSGF